MQDSNLHTDDGKLIAKEKTKMRTRTIIINGKLFELFNADFGATTKFADCWADYNEINRVYGRPSEFKMAIWHEWCNWCYDLNNSGNDCELWIASHNGMTFSIGGKVRFEGHVYDLWITKCHSRAYLIA